MLNIVSSSTLAPTAFRSGTCLSRYNQILSELPLQSRLELRRRKRVWRRYFCIATRGRVSSYFAKWFKLVCSGAQFQGKEVFYLQLRTQSGVNIWQWRTICYLHENVRDRYKPFHFSFVTLCQFQEITARLIKRDKIHKVLKVVLFYVTNDNTSATRSRKL